MRRNFLEMKYSETSALLMAVMIFQLVCYISWGLVCRQIPSYAVFIHLDVLNYAFGIYSLAILVALGWIGVCLHLREQDNKHPMLVVGALIIYVVIMIFAGFISGLLAMSLGVVIAAAPMIGILILPARLVLSATALSSMLLGGLCYASVIGRVPYAPLFKQQVLGESVTYGAFYFWSQICFVVPFLVIIIAAAHLFLTQWRARESHVRYISQTDGLTGVYNRRFAHQYLTESIQEADQQPVGVVLMDLDHFKLINDRHGHLIGDDALRLTANTLREHLRSEDVVARFGGEEFILIFQNTDLAAAMSLAERCRIQIEQMMLYNANGAVPITASFGVTCASHSGQAVDDLLQEADDALYLAKKRGRNQVAAAHEIAATVENKQSVIVLAK